MISGQNDELYTFKYRIIKTFVMIFAWISFGLNQEIIGSTLEDLKIYLEVDYQTISFIINNRNIGFLLTTCFCGLVYDRFSKYAESIMFICCLFIAICSFLMPITKLYWITALYYFLQGVAFAFYDLGGNHIILSLWKGISNSPINAMHAGYGIGALIGVQISKKFIKFDSFDQLEKNSTLFNSTIENKITPNDIELLIPYSIAAGVSVFLGLIFLISQFIETKNKSKYEKKFTEKNDLLEQKIEEPVLKQNNKFLKSFFGDKSYKKYDLVYMFVQIGLITTLLFFILGYYTVISKFMLTYLTKGPGKFNINDYSNIQTLFWLLYVAGRFLAALVAFKMNSILFVSILLLSNLSIVSLFLIPSLCKFKVFFWISVSFLGLVNGPIHPSSIMVAKNFIGDFNSFVMSIFSLGAVLSQLLFQYLTGQLLDIIKPSDYFLGFENFNSAYLIMHISFVPCLFSFLTFILIYIYYKKYFHKIKNGIEN